MSYRSAFRPGLFRDRIAIVTGGGSGIGRCIAHELAALGAKLALLGRRQERLDKVAAEIETDGGAARGFACDIREEDQVAAAVKAVLAAFGRLDCLVNNAGGQFAAPLEAISLRGWEAVVRNNLTGAFLMSREAQRQWMGEHGGAIVNIVADFWNGMPSMAHSGAARAGVVNLTETAASEWARFNIRVNAVAPGWIESSGLESYPVENRGRMKALRQAVPLKRFGDESEVAAAVTFLLSEAAGFVTGVTLRVDGGVPNHRHTFPVPEHEPAPRFRGFPGATKLDWLE
ncbi:MAG: SDR family oxidoreductase [Alphaproteobacteria bacterium]|nr:SDR family oxidoreductase [Alphaproteobacteria bacterium]